MSRTLIIYFAVFILTFASNIVSALTIKLTTKHYFIVPENEEDIGNAIHRSSTLRGSISGYKIKAAATYSGIPNYKYLLKSYRKTCYVTEFNITLNSIITLPRLDMNARKYNDQTLLKFNEYVKNTNTHEKNHHSIDIKYLQQMTNRFRAINSENTTFRTCKDLRNYIRQEIRKTYDIIEKENAKFDCLDYGIESGYHVCKKYDKTPVEMIEQSSNFSTLTQEGRSDVKSYKNTKKPEEQECEGKLIEPFKGKFYCVPSDRFSE